MKKILFFIPTLGGGGAEKVLVNLVNNLDTKKFDITVMTIFDVGTNKKYLNDYIKYKYIFKRMFRGNIHLFKLFSPKFLFKCMIKDRYDIIVSYLEGPTTRIVSGCNDKKTKLINWVHIEIDNINEFKKSYRSLREMKKVYLKYNETIFVSYYAKENFKEMSGISKLKCKVIRNIVDTNDIKNKAKEKIEDNCFNGTKTKIITIGRLTKQKGYDRLLEIHKELINEGYDYCLYILGEGEERRKYEKFIKDNQLEKCTYLMGYTENPYKYLLNSDFFVCSSYKEGYSTAVTEAIILGKPVITTDCSGMSEILENGKYGIIVKNNKNSLKDAIISLLEDKSLIQKYKGLAEKRGSYFEIGNKVREVEKILESV